MRPEWCPAKRNGVIRAMDLRTRRKATRVKQGDVNLAKQAISRSDDLRDELTDLFGQRDDGIHVFAGTRDDKRAIRRAMKDWENERGFGGAKSLYDARYNLQFLPVVEADDE